MEVPNIKLDGDIQIKTEGDSFMHSPRLVGEDDIYEDAGDLDFGDQPPELMLTRVPKFLWKTWSHMDDEQEIQIGLIRVEHDSAGTKRMSIMLSKDVAVNETLPKEYNLTITKNLPANTFIFSEKDLPGYTSNSRTQSSNSQVPPRPQFQDRPKQTYNKNRKWQPYYRRAIPKRTAILGQVNTEVSCLPVENEEYRRIMDERTLQEMKPQRKTGYVSESASMQGGNVLAPGTLSTPGNFANFIKTTSQQRGKPQEAKAARMPQNELLDLIHECFKRYTYWSLRSLKTELNQPEAYLKQTLEMVASLVRTGPHAMTWALKPDYRIGAYELVKDEAAPDADFGFDGQSDAPEGEADVGSDEDDDMKLEDVMPL